MVWDLGEDAMRYSDRRRKLFVRITAGALALLMLGTALSALIFR